MPLPPLVRFLDPRPVDVARESPIGDSVNIPLEKLRSCMHHLPPRHSRVVLAGPMPWAAKAQGFLAESGREAILGEDWTYGERLPGRLWQPNAFLFEVAGRLAPGCACDLACGTGRDAVALAGLGWTVTAIDHLQDALDLGKELAETYLSPAEAGRITWRQANLESPSEVGQFDLVSMAWYLNRELIAGVRELLSPGGSLIAETFTSIHRDRFGKPRTEAFVLQPGELRSLVGELAIKSYSEDWHGDRHSARLWAARN